MEQDRETIRKREREKKGLGFRMNGDLIKRRSIKVLCTEAGYDTKQGVCLVCKGQQCTCDEKSEWLTKRGA